MFGKKWLLKSKRGFIEKIFITKYGVWTKDKVVKSPYKENNVNKVPTSIADFVWLNLHKWADKTAIVCATTHRSYTYNQLFKHSRIFARHLNQYCGLRVKDVVCVLLPNIPEYPVAVLGILDAGGVVCPLNPNSTAYELQRYLSQAHVKAIITTQDKIEYLQNIVKNLQKSIDIIPIQHAVSNENEQDLYLKSKQGSNDKNKLAVLPFSSGTEGLPKCVEVSHQNLIFNCLVQNEDEIKHHNDTTDSHQDTIAVVLPLYHIYGLTVLLLHKLSVGAKLVTLDTFEPITFLSMIRKYKINLLYSVPPIVQIIGSHPSVTKEQLRSVDRIVVGAAPVSCQDVNSVKERINPNIRFAQLYGSTETLLVTASKLELESLASAGRLVPDTTIRIVNAEFENQGPNEIGEIIARGPQVTGGYHKNPEFTKSAFIEDGWFRTGDLGRVSENGDITICGRIKELIKVKGYQVSPLELEEVFKSHPSVQDAAVIGVPNPKHGELPKAFVVLSYNDTFEKAEILRFVNCKVVQYKNVSDMEIVQELPKSPTGKLLRKVLKEIYLNKS